MQNGENHDLFQIAKAESAPFTETVRLIPGTGSDFFKLEANLYRPEVYRVAVPHSQFYTYMTGKNVLRYDLITKNGNQRYFAMRGKKFIPWVLDLYGRNQIEYIMGEWEPDSDNHTTFFRGIEADMSPGQALQETWTFKQYAQNGYGRVIEIETHQHFLLPPLNIPQTTVVNVLFGKS
ncbi:hypothetical protein KC726_00930 [Candidatus Woesebacteria bacterium]|nr:hypothetical protein [Candidatus Woesebacteria bacterium]